MDFTADCRVHGVDGSGKFQSFDIFPQLGGGDGSPPPSSGGRGTVSPYYDFGAKGDKQADDKQAFVSAIGTGQVIDISSPNDNYKITAGDLQAGGKDLYLVGKGTIWYPRSKPALTFAPVLGPKIAVLSFRNVEHPPNLNVPVTSFTVSAADRALLAIGNVLVFRSTTKIGWGVTPAEDAGRGEEAEIIDINSSNNTVYLNRVLQWIGTPCAFDGVTTVDNTCRTLSEPKLYIGSGINFECYEDVEAAGPRNRATVLVIGARRPELYGNIQSAPSRGWMLVGCWLAETNFYARRCRDDLNNNGIGYGCVLAGACYGASIKGTYEECRHGVSTNTYPDSNDAYAGAPLECTFKDSLVVRGSATAYDNHAGALRTRYINNRVVGMAANASGSSAGLYCAQDRGLETEIDGLWSSGFPGGLYFVPAGPPVGSNFVAGDKYVCKFRNVHVSAGVIEESTIAAGIPAFASSGGANSQWMKVQIENSTFRNMDPIFAADMPELELSWTKMTDCGTFRCGDAQVKFQHFTLENTDGAAKEGVQFTNGADIVAVHMHFDGIFSPSLFRCGSSSGSGASLRTGAITHVPPSGVLASLKSSAGASFNHVSLLLD